MIDVFQKYYQKDGFDLLALLDDDFIDPVRLLFNNRRFISAAKLLLVAIDSIGFLEFGNDSRCPFIDWLNQYADISPLGITPMELWEHRNSLLHMSNLDSRKVVAEKVRRLLPYVGCLPEGACLQENFAKFYNLKILIQCVARACGEWGRSLNENHAKFKGFAERYDLVTSDVRFAEIGDELRP
jgi:hypothetical protein